jgi:hypothetical protein
MKNCHSCKIALCLFALLFICADVNADAELRPFTFYKQEGVNTCWATCVRMVMAYYGVIIEEEKEGKERDIRRLAFNVPDTAPAPDRPQVFDFAGNMLVRLLITAGIQPGSGSLTRDVVKYLLDRGLPVIAGTKRVQNMTMCADGQRSARFVCVDTETGRHVSSLPHAHGHRYRLRLSVRGFDRAFD